MFAVSPMMMRATALPLRAAAPVALDPSLALYELQLTAESLVAQQLQSLTPLSALTLYAAGLLTSLTPCCLSMLPLTVAYFATADTSSDGAGAKRGAMLPALSYTAGLACALAALGVAAASLGKIYGDAAGAAGGDVLRLGVSLLAVGMGLNLLQLVPLTLGLGSYLVDPNAPEGPNQLPASARAFAFGASSALVSSPCASPVLASILGFVATLGDPLLGGALLVCYTLGYTTPIGVASLLTSRATATLDGRTFAWVQPVGGAFLVAFGTYNGLVAALGPA